MFLIFMHYILFYLYFSVNNYFFNNHFYKSFYLSYPLITVCPFLTERLSKNRLTNPKTYRIL
ncbi:hypothetical protein RUMHYD_03169 [Blautia hydrogenotrophica DSM 10507]|uniref:Uncharacterized protein n=1 Tax=Blautia hydrogenotrophica (strain DSM 10507 / JCM 14656 / S5a33) TaxID=476272 RepID=C0CQK6_BLAHS|nr:hypothetical protein RUMHYD_03169 [Blautia hydrogenotrophica DSM 10507]